jgi:hypothetical protein
MFGAGPGPSMGSGTGARSGPGMGRHGREAWRRAAAAGGPRRETRQRRAAGGAGPGPGSRTAGGATVQPGPNTKIATVSATDWATVADLATAMGTLVLAIATFSAIRSANRSARLAERALLAGLRPLLVPTRREDTTLKVNFGDGKWVHLPGGGAAAEVGGGDGTLGPGSNVVYLAVPLRNAGSGIGVVLGWIFYPEWHRGEVHPALDEFTPNTRDLYVPPGDLGFWQGAFRDPADPRYPDARKAVESRQPWTVDLLYSDHEGGQRLITRLTAFAKDDAGWIVSSSRHWSVDGKDPRRQ